MLVHVEIRGWYLARLLSRVPLVFTCSALGLITSAGYHISFFFFLFLNMGSGDEFKTCLHACRANTSLNKPFPQAYLDKS